MALNQTVLGSLIVAELSSQGFDVSNEHSWVSKFATAIATAIVSHITSASGYNTHIHSDPQGGSTGTPVPSIQ